MHIPNFTAESSIYRTKSVYRAAGAELQAEAVFPALSGGPFESHGSHSCGCGLHQFAVGSLPQFRADYGHWPVAETARTVFPMSVSGHQTDLSGQCSACQDECLAIGLGCEAGVALGCMAALAIPFIGEIAYFACAGIGFVACYFAWENCFNNCHNIGSACCPTQCGNRCCGGSETCLDSGKGLCCSAGMKGCQGPLGESCYDPNSEVCSVSGIACPGTSLCGDNCCGEGAVCIDSSSGTCCNVLTGIVCHGECCDGSRQRCTNTGCCLKEQACGDVCCPFGSICGPNGNCITAPACGPNEFLCVSSDGSKQNCCPGNADCCLDGSCCVGPGMSCCGSAGCRVTGYCE
jgi:hypothetical protein